MIRKLYKAWMLVIFVFGLGLTENGFSKDRVLEHLAENFSDFDLYLSANDRFLQILQFPGEPVHVSTNGGGEKLEQVPLRDQHGEFTIAQHGFARVIVDTRKLSVELYDHNGRATCETKWIKRDVPFFINPFTY